MRGNALALALTTAILTAIAGSATRTQAGIFVTGLRSTQIQVDPPRYRSVIFFYDRYSQALYGIRADTSMVDGNMPRARILEATGPSWMQVSVDTTAGTALWLSDPIPPPNFADSLLVVTATPNPCFEMVYLVPPAGTPYKYIQLCFATDEVTEARPSTWGRLKGSYR